MTRKEIITNVYGFGGLIGAIVVFIITWIYMGHDTWFVKISLSFIMGIISTGIIGSALGAITFILLLPFYRSIPWDIENEEDTSPIPEKIFKLIKERWEILDIR